MKPNSMAVYHDPTHSMAQTTPVDRPNFNRASAIKTAS